MAHTCNPSYSGSRDQEDHGSKPAQANSSTDPISKTPNLKKRAGGVAQVVDCLPTHVQRPEFKPQYHQKTKKKEKPNKIWSIMGSVGGAGGTKEDK
jgi:hypothetical protein